jgi:hypothetical protein
MVSSNGRLTRRRCGLTEIGVGGDRASQGWPAGEVLLASISRPHATYCLLAMPDAALGGTALTDFLARVAPFGCPPPSSLIRAYRLPDSPFPSILLKEHEEASADVGEAYRRFLARARLEWLAALEETGPGLCPALAWQAGPTRRLLALDAWTKLAAEAGIAISGVADDYLGRGLLLLAHPDLAVAWPTMMSLGGITKIRKITGREFPVWVDLPAHQSALLDSPLLTRAERLLAEA